MALLVCKIVVTVLVFLFLLFFYNEGGVGSYYDGLKKRNLESLLTKPRKRISYEDMQRYLDRNGAGFHLKKNITPFDFLVIRCGVCFGGVLLGLIFHPIVSVLFGVVCYWMPKLYVDSRNEKDNDEMLSYLPEIYSTISLQTNNGVFLSNAVYECYLVTRMPRLKQALLELSKEIEGAESIQLAAEHFKQKFNNPYIDAFSRAIEQSLISGEAGQIFKDISKQLESINEALYLKEEKKINDRVLLGMTLAVIAAVIGMGYIMLLGLLSDIDILF